MRNAREFDVRSDWSKTLKKGERVHSIVHDRNRITKATYYAAKQCDCKQPRKPSRGFSPPTDMCLDCGGWVAEHPCACGKPRVIFVEGRVAHPKCGNCGGMRE